MERERSSLLTVRGEGGLTSFSLSSRLASSDLLLPLELADKFL